MESQKLLSNGSSQQNVSVMIVDQGRVQNQSTGQLNGIRDGLPNNNKTLQELVKRNSDRLTFVELRQSKSIQFQNAMSHQFQATKSQLTDQVVHLTSELKTTKDQVQTLTSEVVNLKEQVQRLTSRMNGKDGRDQELAARLDRREQQLKIEEYLQLRNVYKSMENMFNAMFNPTDMISFFNTQVDRVAREKLRTHQMQPTPAASPPNQPSSTPSTLEQLLKPGPSTPARASPHIAPRTPQRRVQTSPYPRPTQRRSKPQNRYQASPASSGSSNVIQRAPLPPTPPGQFSPAQLQHLYLEQLKYHHMQQMQANQISQLSQNQAHQSHFPATNPTIPSQAPNPADVLAFQQMLAQQQAAEQNRLLNQQLLAAQAAQPTVSVAATVTIPSAGLSAYGQHYPASREP